MIFAKSQWTKLVLVNVEASNNLRKQAPNKNVNLS